MHDDKPCGRPLHNGGETCICHSDDPNKDIRLFQQELDALLSNIATRVFDFTSFVFPESGYRLPSSYGKAVAFDYATFLGEARFRNVQFLGEARFIGTRFLDLAVFDVVRFDGSSVFFAGARFQNMAGFSAARFKGRTIFNGAKFRGSEQNFEYATFHDEARFSATKFRGFTRFNFAKFLNEAVFAGSEFEDHAIFKKVEFYGKVDFWGTKFRGKENTADFSSAEFKSEVDFSGAKLEGLAVFQSAEFQSNADFSAVEFCGGVDFHLLNANEKSHVVFLGTFFLKNASFFGATVKGRIDFHSANSADQQLRFVDFRGCGINQAQKVTFRNMSLEKILLLETDISKEVSFVNVVWYSKSKFFGLGSSKIFGWLPQFLGSSPTRTAVYDEVCLDPENPSAVQQELFNHELVARLYRQLQANYIENYNYTEAGDFYIGEQEMLRKSKGRWGQFFSTNCLYKVLSYYGESVVLPVFWLLVTLCGFSLWILFETSYDWAWGGQFLLFTTDFWNAFFRNLSFVAFNQRATLEKFSEPYQWALIAIEQIIVASLITLFILALRRKFRRKSF